MFPSRTGDLRVTPPDIPYHRALAHGTGPGFGILRAVRSGRVHDLASQVRGDPGLFHGFTEGQGNLMRQTPVHGVPVQVVNESSANRIVTRVAHLVEVQIGHFGQHAISRQIEDSLGICDETDVGDRTRDAVHRVEQTLNSPPTQAERRGAQDQHDTQQTVHHLPWVRTASEQKSATATRHQRGVTAGHRFEPETRIGPAPPLAYYGPPDRSSTRMGPPSTQPTCRRRPRCQGRMDCPRGQFIDLPPGRPRPPSRSSPR